VSERHPADPPKPIPEHLWPWGRRGVGAPPLGPGDLRIAPSTAELRVLVATLDAEGIAGQTLVTQRDGSPWLELDVAVPYGAEGRSFVGSELGGSLAVGGRVYRYALWRYTLKVHRVGDDGAVEDDPLEDLGVGRFLRIAAAALERAEVGDADEAAAILREIVALDGSPAGVPPERQTDEVSFRLSPRLRSALEERAQAEETSVSEMVREALATRWGIR
jgi:predicted HicB family RNase H-like nuclease